MKLIASIIVILVLAPFYGFSYFSADTLLTVSKLEYPGSMPINLKTIQGEKIIMNNNFTGNPVGLEDYEYFRLRFQRNMGDSSTNPSNNLLELNVLSGLKGNKKIIIADINRDNNFSNDSVYEYPISKSTRRLSLESVKFIAIPYSYYYRGKMYNRSVELMMLPFEPERLAATSTQELLKVYFKIKASRAFKFKLATSEFKIRLLNSLDLDAGYSNCELEIRDSQDKILNYDPSLKAGDVFVLGEKSLTINKISFFGDSLDLKINDLSKMTGVRTENILPAALVSALDKELTNGAFFRNKYLLIDFWGSWCAPCIASIPELREIYKSYESGGKLRMLSVAFERRKDTTILKSLIERNKMTWEHVTEFDTIGSNPVSLVSEFEITGFPTTILLDENYKVLFRGLGLQNVVGLKAALGKILE